MVLKYVLVTLAAMSLGSAVLAMIWNVNGNYNNVTSCMYCIIRMAELVDASDLKSGGQKCSCGFDSRSGYN